MWHYNYRCPLYDEHVHRCVLLCTNCHGRVSFIRAVNDAPMQRPAEKMMSLEIQCNFFYNSTAYKRCLFQPVAVRKLQF